MLENYEILNSIGTGRYAEVFRAVKRDLGREVALKILTPNWNENATVRDTPLQRQAARCESPFCSTVSSII